MEPTFYAAPGANVIDVIDDVMEFVRLFQTPAHFVHNGRSVLVRENSTRDELYADWSAAMSRS